jgi:hypothetical protein
MKPTDRAARKLKQELPQTPKALENPPSIKVALPSDKPKVSTPNTTPKIKTKKAPPFTGFIKIKAKCGCEIDFGIWEPEATKDIFRENRKKKHENKICTPCREKQESEARELKAKLKLEKLAKRPKGTLSRLPDESVFKAIYDASCVLWTGTLDIQVKGEYKTFSVQAKALFTLLPKLDYQYRKWIEEQENKSRETAIDRNQCDTVE